MSNAPATANQNAPAPAKEPGTFREMILTEKYKNQLAAALPKGLTADRMIRVVLTAMNRTPKLLNCTKESLWLSVLNCAALGLLPDPLGRAYLVPYGTKCELIIGYKGLIDLAYRSDRIGMIQLKAVYAGDDFIYEFGLEPMLDHKPCDRPGPLTHVYSIVHIKGCDSPSFDVMRKDEVDAIRKRSKAANDGPWVTDYDAMAMKTVFRRHSKVLPMSAELAQALEHDTELDLKSVELMGVSDSRFSDDKAPGEEQAGEQKAGAQ